MTPSHTPSPTSPSALADLAARPLTRRGLVGLGSAAVLASLAACGSSSGGTADATASSGASAGGASAAASGPAAEDSATGVPATLSPGMGSGAADGVFPRDVVHYQGTTTITAAPSKVVVLSTGQADAMLTLGMCPIGSSAASGTDAPVPQYLQDAFPEQAAAIKAITYVGSRMEPDVEAIAALHPDLILVNIAGKDDAAAMYTSLSAVAPTVATHGTGQYWKVDFLLLADALGKREAAQAEIDAVTAAAASAGAGLTSPGTVSLLRKNGDKLRVFGPLSFPGSLVAEMGLARPASQQFTTGVSTDLSEETLDQADGDWLLYAVQGGDESEATALPLWSSLGAVSAHHAVEVDDDPFFLNAGPRAARTVISATAAALAS